MNYNSNEINFSQNSILSNINPSQSPLIHNEGFYSNLSLNQNINKNSLFDINKNINSKIIFDPIHDYITFPSKLWEIIDTSEFQRLRRLKQLSTVCYIFNGGNHTRFEHCIGTGFLSQDLIKRIFKKINIKNNNNEIEYIINSVSIAGLCHDIAHGPFSHLFNTILNRLNLNCVFDHEIFSKNIIEYLIDNNNIEDIDKDMINLISSLITGVPLTDSNVKSSIIEDYSFIYQIVANKLNSIDVDKFDYIVRDIYHLGISNLSVDYKRVYNDINIIDNKICFSEKNSFALESIFLSREMLHKKVYKHNKHLCVDSMIRDALFYTNEYFKLEECINDVEKFLNLDDDIIQIIRNFDEEECKEHHNYLKAKNIIYDLYNRKIYKFVGEILFPIGVYFKPKIEDFLSIENPKDEFYLTKDDIELFVISIDMGYKDKNPFEKIYFYNPNFEDKCFKKLMNYNLNHKDVFREFYLKVICKNNYKFERACEIFEKYKKKLLKFWNENEINESNKKFNLNDLINEEENQKTIKKDNENNIYLNKKRNNNNINEFKM